MEAQWVVDRQQLRRLLKSHPTWKLQDFADTIGRSLSWVKTWVKRLKAVPPEDEQVLLGYSCARKTPPPSISPRVVEHILAIRDNPPHNLGRIPGPKAILYYLHQEAQTTLAGEYLPRSTRTVWGILRQYQRILDPPVHEHHPLERPAPLSSWQLDFKDASTVPADPEGKQQHVVEVLNSVDVGTSILLDAQVRSDFTLATAIEAMAQTLQSNGLPEQVTFDRDPRFVGETSQRESPSPFLRFWLCLGVEITICPPRRPDVNGFVERYHRSYDEECLQVHRPADEETVKSVTAAFAQHYNFERPHQGVSCQNQPPRVAFPDLPARPPVPQTVDPDRWIDALDGKCYVRKVQRDTSVSIGAGRYYVSQALVGKHVTLRIAAADRCYVIAYEGQEVKRVPIGGTGRGPRGFAQFVEELTSEARTGRVPPQQRPFQLSLPLEAQNA
jgi:transposase InsO family protein